MLQTAESEISAAMRAVTFDQTVTPRVVAKQHEVFAEQFHRAYRSRAIEFVDQRRRLPIHPHQLSAGVFGPGAGDQVVLFLAHHGALPHPKKACGGRQLQLGLFFY
jgi:hypothetical protein